MPSREPSAKFYCEACGHPTVTRVLDTRGHRRRRQCMECLGTFPTVEVRARRGKEPIHRAPVKAFDLPFDVEQKAS